MDLIEELKWRGMLHDIMPGLEEQLAKESTAGYVGFDPTADSLHIGNLVPVMLLLHWQRAGHKPVVLVGGATGMVGDPSGKTKERQLLDLDVMEHNLNSQKNQLKKFLDFEGENAARVVNNFDWFKDINFLEFIRDVGKHITVNYMMSKDSVKNRLEDGMSFTEFTYQLVQGYDFYHLWKNENCKVQMGGSDQWGNILTGTELIRKKGSGQAFALTAPLITKADGSKFGKSEGGNIWIDKKRTSAYKFYQYWLNVADEDAGKFIRIFTLKSKNEIESLEAAHTENPRARILQTALAEDITTRVHSEEDLKTAVAASEILFGKSAKSDLENLPESEFLSVFEGVDKATISLELLNSSVGVIDLLSEYTGFLSSKGEARRALKENSIRLNKDIVEESKSVDRSDLLNGKYLLLQRGKKNYFLVSVS
ncbi:MAG: tyrosine--tRNA ligase [Bacteroidetes bacterium]|nr:tyrosine--tRNA ligase [Bacteroidota bacterium]MDA0979800.1 tyrosine--tRNA ligase [Bacteroidota bacterium]